MGELLHVQAHKIVEECGPAPRGSDDVNGRVAGLGSEAAEKNAVSQLSQANNETEKEIQSQNAHRVGSASNRYPSPRKSQVKGLSKGAEMEGHLQNLVCRASALFCHRGMILSQNTYR